MDWITAMGSLATGALGGIGTVYGLARYLGSMWLEKQKAIYAKELEEFRDSLLKEQRRMQAEIDRSVFVTRGHFETEFNAMKEVFKHLSEVRLSMNSVRPLVSTSGESQGKDCLAALERAYNVLLTESEALSPFYPPELHEAVGICRTAANTEIMEVRTGDPSDKARWFEDGRRNQLQYKAGYDNASMIIRERLLHLAILPKT